MNSSKLLKTVSLSLVLLGICSAEGVSSVAAQSNLTSPVAASETQYQQKIYVNPNTGNDQTGQGTEAEPFQTITQALMLAQPNSIIYLAPGKYTQATGEVFPLLLNAQVTLEGHPRSLGYNVIIEGNGTYISPTAAGQNVTMVIAEPDAKVTGVTVINPTPRGHGIWLESANAEISYNTFTRNGNAGLSVNGKSNPLITHNYFYNNIGNGLLVYGSSEAVVRENIFEKSGFGISVVENGKALIVANQIRGNRIGVIVEENGEVVLRENLIEQSREDGLVTIAQAKANLGTPEEAGGNTVQNNQGLAIRNLTPETIVAVGNQISGQWLGKVDLQSRQAVSPLFPALPNPPQTESNLSTPLPPPPQTESNLNTPLPPPPRAIATQPQTESNLSTPLPPPPQTESNLNPPVSTPPRAIANQPQTESYNSYRVIADAQGAQEQKVKAIYPDAFRTIYYGKPMLQIGVYSTWANAEKTMTTLKSLGIQEVIIFVDPC